MKKLVIAALLAGAATLPAQASVNFSGSGTSGTDPLGHSWNYSETYGPAWGSPGLGLGVIQFNPANATVNAGAPCSTCATSFTFTVLNQGVTINDAPFNIGGFESTTRFGNVGIGDYWTRTFLSPSSVRFTTTTAINPGDLFFVNVSLNQSVGEELQFEASWGNSGVVPEPATWAMMIMGFGLVGMAARRRAGLSRATA